MLSLVILILHVGSLTCYTVYNGGCVALLVAPLAHFLTWRYNSLCFRGHCECPPQHTYEPCKVCGARKWVRMRHCYQCGRCVHKRDHHCVLLCICIGQFNHKYYIVFLVSHLCNSLVIVGHLLRVLPGEVAISPGGIQTLSHRYYWMSCTCVFLVLNLVLLCYLTLLHLYILAFNETTYEIQRRLKCKYLSGTTASHPFDRGICNNLKMAILASTHHPIQWHIPHRRFESEFPAEICHGYSDQQNIS